MWSELPVTCHISGASMTSYLVITGMLIHRYKRFSKIMDENRFSEEDDDNTYRYNIATTLTGLAVSFPMIWEIWNCITKQHQSINYRCGPLFISINMISICLLFFIVCNIWTSIRLKSLLTKPQIRRSTYNEEQTQSELKPRENLVIYCLHLE